MFVLVATGFFYTWNLDIYAMVQDEEPYNLENYVKKVFMESLHRSNSWFWCTSFGLANDLLGKKLLLSEQ